ncbi:Crp/Fnr family transcriptional regulator [Aquisalimonas sp. 2447]|uniref:Crp/Fnr family transcriptional regulator n=1 Tax=Aquisalimonas sp. 2447 TaxID=2740807 RepID=UPI0014326310|nr:Crp/Fnr family transcriptional regulator [Aquisalimonas sp. 2447]QIT54538.1 Crp/Fnr family transcriptional regulator [Aquisalimonas sp. 2447]
MSNAEITAEIRNEPFFAGLDEPVLQYLGSHATRQVLPKGNLLFRQGDAADAFYMLLGGEILVEIPAITGPSLEIQRLGQGQVLGWSWLISPYRWTFQARAEEDTEVLAFDGAAILAHCEENPDFGYALLKRFSALMSERLEAARRRMMDEWNPPGFA